MRIALLGAHGQLGSDISRVHMREKVPVDLIPLGRSEVDVVDRDRLYQILSDVNADAIINCTSYHNTDEVEANAEYATAVNAHAVKNLAEFAQSNKCRLLHISTDYVFGGNEDAREPLSEDACAAPVNVYGATKLLGESLARINNPSCLILRVASLFGVSGASGKGGNFVETMLRLGNQRDELSVVGDQIMSPTWTMDIAETALGLLTGEASEGIYHVVNTGAVSWFEFAKTIFSKAKVNVKLNEIESHEYPTVATRPSYSALDNTKVCRELQQDLKSWDAALDGYFDQKQVL